MRGVVSWDLLDMICKYSVWPTSSSVLQISQGSQSIASTISVHILQTSYNNHRP